MFYTKFNSVSKLIIVTIYISILSFSCKSKINNEKISLAYSSVKTEGYDSDKYIYTSSIEKKSIIISKIEISYINKILCLKHNSTFKQVITLTPIIVECIVTENSERILVGNSWNHTLRRHQRIIGNNKEYLIMNDLSIIDKINGKLINIMKSSDDFTVASLSTNSNYFYYKDNSIFEITTDGSSSHIVSLPSKYFRKTLVKNMILNNEGDHIILLVELNSRGRDMLFLYIINIDNKEIVFEKELEKNCICNNYFIMYQPKGSILIYRDLNKQVVNSYHINFR